MIHKSFEFDFYVKSGILLKRSEAGSLAPIVAVMLPEVLAFEA